MKVWVTKYWETQGIYTIEAEAKDRAGSRLKGEYVWSVVSEEDARKGVVRQMLKLGRDCFEKKLAAEDWVRVQRDKKVAALEKRIEKLKSLKMHELSKRKVV